MNTVVAAHWQMNVETNTFSYIQVLMITVEILRESHHCMRACYIGDINWY